MENFNDELVKKQASEEKLRKADEKTLKNKVKERSKVAIEDIKSYGKNKKHELKKTMNELKKTIKF